MKMDPYGNYAEGGQDILRTSIKGTIDNPISYKFPVSRGQSSTSFQLTGRLVHSMFEQEIIPFASKAVVKRRLLRGNEATVQLQITSGSPALVKINGSAGGFSFNGTERKWPSRLAPLRVRFTTDGGETFSFCWPWNKTLDFGNFIISNVSDDGTF